MYRGDGALSDGMEHVSEETLDEAEHPLTVVLVSSQATSRERQLLVEEIIYQLI